MRVCLGQLEADPLQHHVAAVGHADEQVTGHHRVALVEDFLPEFQRIKEVDKRLLRRLHTGMGGAVRILPVHLDAFVVRVAVLRILHLVEQPLESRVVRIAVTGHGEQLLPDHVELCRFPRSLHRRAEHQQMVAARHPDRVVLRHQKHREPTPVPCPLRVDNPVVLGDLRHPVDDTVQLVVLDRLR